MNLEDLSSRKKLGSILLLQRAPEISNFASFW